MDKTTKKIVIIGGVAFLLLGAYCIYLHERERKMYERLLQAYQRQTIPVAYNPQMAIEKPMVKLMPKPQPSALDELLKKAMWVKHQIEERKGFEQFYGADKKLQKGKLENIMHHIYDASWHRSMFNYDKEVNNGGGPVDGVASLGASNKALIEFKIAANSTLKNLLEQVDIYKKACRTKKSLLVFVCFKDTDITRLEKALKEHNLFNDPYVVTIDARFRNIPASKFRPKFNTNDFGRIRVAG